MPFDYETLLNWKLDDVVQTYDFRDTILYALGLGYGADPLDEDELRFVYEENLKTVPTMCVVLGHPGFWVKDPRTGVDWVKVLHGEQGFRIHKPLPPKGTVIGRTRVTDIIDKGPGKGALIFSEKQVIDQATGELLATTASTTFARGDGGCGGPQKPQPQPHALPDRDPDGAIDIPTRPEAALIYRLSGDYNPLHADPKVARAAGFKAPILHGLCTYGVASRGLIATVCGGEPDRLTSMQARFTSPVYPGETIRIETWTDGGIVSFRASVVERDVIVLNNGRAEIA